jgi:hypothetical protein
MSNKIEHHNFAVGQEIGGCGRCTRAVLGLLGLLYIGVEVSQSGPSAALVAQLAGGFLSTAVLYVVLFWLLGARMRHPWLRTGLLRDRGPACSISSLQSA